MATEIAVPAGITAMASDPAGKALAAIVTHSEGASASSTVEPHAPFTVTARLAVAGTPGAVAFSPSGSRLAVVSTVPAGPPKVPGVPADPGKAYLTVFDLTTPHRRKVLTADLPLGGGATFDGNEQLVTYGADGNVNLIDLSPAALVNSACAIAARNLTRQEFADYLNGPAVGRRAHAVASGTAAFAAGNVPAHRRRDPSGGRDGARRDTVPDLRPAPGPGCCRARVHRRHPSPTHRLVPVQLNQGVNEPTAAWDEDLHCLAENRPTVQQNSITGPWPAETPVGRVGLEPTTQGL